MSTAASASTPTLSTPLKVVTIIFTALAAIGLAVTVLLLIVTVASFAADDDGGAWYLGFSTIASILNAISAVVALVLGIVGSRRGRNPVSLAAAIVGAAALVILVAQLVFISLV